MTEQELAVFYFLVHPWVVELLAEHAQTARPVESFGFSRLPAYFSAPQLASTKVVVVKKVPIPPFRAMGLSKIVSFEDLNPDSIPYHDTYFIKQGCETKESIHFHELVHMIQWRTLGPEQFLKVYAEGLSQMGFRAQDYRKGPLEVIACELQARFEKDEALFDVEAEVIARLKGLSSAAPE